MDSTLYVGLDVSLDETSVCIVDQDGKIEQEMKVESEPDALRSALDVAPRRFPARLLQLLLEELTGDQQRPNRPAEIAATGEDCLVDIVVGDANGRRLVGYEFG